MSILEKRLMMLSVCNLEKLIDSCEKQLEKTDCELSVENIAIDSVISITRDIIKAKELEAKAKEFRRYE